MADDSISIRTIEADELVQWANHTARAFGGSRREDEVDEYLRPHIVYRDAFGAFDGDEVVGTAHHEPAPLTLPGGAVLDCAGLTRVSVSSTHRRRGIVRQMLTSLLRQVREDGVALSSLWASEAPIYGRFGYGLATVHESWKLDRRDGFAWWAPHPEGRVRFITTEDARTALPPLFEEYARLHPGASPRIAYRWDSILDDREQDRHGASPLSVVTYEDGAGDVQGYATYRLKGDWPNGIPSAELAVSEVVALTPDAEIGLWRYLLSIDLVGTVSANDQPLDAALPWALADFRRIERRQRDGLHLRVLDIPRAFEARAYLGSDRVVFEVPDDFLPETGGRFVLDATPDGAQVTTTDEEPEMVLRPAAVGSLLLATAPGSLLGRAGLIEERVDGALARADELFRWTEPPRTLYHF